MNASKANTLKIFAFIFMFFIGLGWVMYTVMLPKIVTAYHLEPSQSGLIVPFISMGEFIAVLTGGFIVDRVKKVYLILISFTFFACSFLFIGIVPPIYGILVSFFSIGLFGGLLNTIINSYIADVFSENRGAYMNILQSLNAIGSLLGPLYCTFILNIGFNWNSAYLFLGVFCTLMLLIYAPFAVHGGSFFEAENINSKKIYFFSLLKDKRILLLVLMELIYTGYTFAFNTWIPSYMTNILKLNQGFIGGAISGYWTGMILGRLIYPIFSKKMPPERFLLFGNITAGIFLLIGVYMDIPALLAVMVFLTGLCTAINHPLMMTIACNIYTKNSGSATTVILLGGSVGGILFPALLGLVVKNISFRYACLLIPVILLIVGAMALLLTHMLQKPEQRYRRVV